MHYRLAVRFAIEGDLRFISHHDTLRLFERALSRAGVPVRFSAGFNPRPRMRLALPRPVGVASQDELLVVELSEELAPQDAQIALAQQMPEGLTLLSADALTEGDDRRPCAAIYELAVSSDSSEPVAKQAAAFMASPRMIVQRTVPKTQRTKSIDVRSFIGRMQVADGRLTWEQTISQDGTARLGEVLEALGLSVQDNLHRVRRQAVRYEP